MQRNHIKIFTKLYSLKAIFSLSDFFMLKERLVVVILKCMRLVNTSRILTCNDNSILSVFKNIPISDNEHTEYIDIIKICEVVFSKSSLKNKKFHVDTCRSCIFTANKLNEDKLFFLSENRYYRT